MSRARLLASITLLAAVGAIGLCRAEPETPSPPPLSAPRATRASPAAPLAQAAPSPERALAERPREPRQSLADELPAEGPVGRLVQAAMRKEGDSDRRLLDGLAWLGLHPSVAASFASRLDPWLAVGLVDLERQMARRCAALGGQRPRCFERALLASEALGLALQSHPAGTALRRFHEHDAQRALAPE